MKSFAIGISVFSALLGIVLLGAWDIRVQTEHDIAARYYHRCRENLGLFEPMTTLAKGESACSHLIEEELGIVNRWQEELP